MKYKILFVLSILLILLVGCQTNDIKQEDINIDCLMDEAENMMYNYQNEWYAQILNINDKSTIGNIKQHYFTWYTNVNGNEGYSRMMAKRILETNIKKCSNLESYEPHNFRQLVKDGDVFKFN